MTEALPRSIRLFEALSIASIALGMLHEIIFTGASSIGMIVFAAVMLALILLVSRRRKNWARWLLAFMFVVGAVLMVVDLQTTLAVGYPVITFGVALLQAAGVALLFTRQSSEWFRNRPSVAETFN